MRGLVALLIFALLLAPAACSQRTEQVEQTPTQAGTETEQQRLGGSATPTTMALIALGVVVLIAIAVASAHSDPFLDYTGQCGTPDCS